MRTLSEHELLKSISGGDRTAFTTLYRQYVPQLYQYIFFISNSKDVSEEIAQEVFLKIWEQRATLENITLLKAYIFRCAKNLLLDHLKRQKLYQNKILPAVAKEEMWDDTDDRVIVEHKKQIIQYAISKLPEKRKEIVKLRINEHYTIRQIARQLSISGSVVKKQLYTGLAFVKDYVSRHNDLFTVILLWIHFVK